MWTTLLLLLPQRYIFSSKSQLLVQLLLCHFCCCCYHKGIYFQANHNAALLADFCLDVVVATTKVYIFKQITTDWSIIRLRSGCCCYHKGIYFQANHNGYELTPLATVLLLLPQRYISSSKSQPKAQMIIADPRCCCYHKGTYFQANHNHHRHFDVNHPVVVATTKVHIFKQITTTCATVALPLLLLLLPQRYIFSSKSQRSLVSWLLLGRCCCYHKGIYFQANHNWLVNHSVTFRLLLLPQRYIFSSKSQRLWVNSSSYGVVVATTKVYIFKQITTKSTDDNSRPTLLLLPQRYIFSSKSQLISCIIITTKCCCCYHKGTYFQAKHNFSDLYTDDEIVVVATIKVHNFR